MMNLEIRKASASDWQAISDVVTAAFEGEGPEITKLIDGLLQDSSAYPLLSLVATIHDHVVGHILFTNTQIKHAQQTVSSAILAPLAVHPNHQNQGVGAQLIREGLKQLKTAGVELVFVLGHPDYYPKHGFSAAGIKGFEATYPISPENADAWMVQELHSGALERVSGQVICADTLNDPKYWRE